MESQHLVCIQWKKGKEKKPSSSKRISHMGKKNKRSQWISFVCTTKRCLCVVHPVRTCACLLLRAAGFPFIEHQPGSDDEENEKEGGSGGGGVKVKGTAVCCGSLKLPLVSVQAGRPAVSASSAVGSFFIFLVTDQSLKQISCFFVFCFFSKKQTKTITKIGKKLLFKKSK